jgi:hypothetical protein
MQRILGKAGYRISYRIPVACRIFGLTFIFLEKYQIKALKLTGVSNHFAKHFLLKKIIFA